MPATRCIHGQDAHATWLEVVEGGACLLGELDEGLGVLWGVFLPEVQEEVGDGVFGGMRGVGDM